MYNLILVDDEKSILENMSNSFVWEEFGFSLVGKFTSAAKALEFIETDDVDCIISDIKMPVMDGIEFSKMVHDKYPDIYFVILSAYADFEYAQKAMINGVSEYIIKPITFSKIQNALNKAKSKLDKTEKFSHVISNKHKIASLLVNGKVSQSDSAAEMLLNGNIITDPSKAKFAIIRVNAEELEKFILYSWPYDNEQFQNAFSYVIESGADGLIETMRGYGSVELLYVCQTDETNFPNCISKTLVLIENNCFELLNLHVVCDVVSIFNNIDELIIGCIYKTNYKPDMSDLIEYVTSGNTAKTQEYIEQNLLKEKDNFQYIKNFLACFAVEIANYDDLRKIDNTFSLRNTFKSSEEIVQYTTNLINVTTEYFAKNKKRVPNMMQIVKCYIEEHYNEELTLSMIAKTVFLSESHISRTFKRVFGESVVSYLNKVRLKHAMEMLLTSELSIDEICYAVGYKSRNMFYKYFKMTYGKTPSAYRRENSEKNK